MAETAPGLLAPGAVAPLPQAPPPQAQPNQPSTAFTDFVTNARASGYSRDQIQQFVSAKYDAAISRGADPVKLATSLGWNPPARAATDQALTDNAVRTFAATPQTIPLDRANPYDLFKAGIQASSGGMIEGQILTGKPVQQFQLPDHAGIAARLLYKSGSLVGDLPAMIAGGLGAGFTAGPYAGGAASFALPTFLRGAYIDSVRNGGVQSPQDFAERYSTIATATARDGAVGWFTAGAGQFVHAGMEAAGVSLVPRTFLTGSAELATMTTASAVLAGQLPSKEDLIDNALLMVGMHAGVHFGKGAMSAARSPTVEGTRDNLGRNYVATGETPQAATARALNDPPLRQTFSTPPEAPRWTPPGSAHVADEHSSSLTVPRVPGNFEAAVAWVLKTEGGYVVDSGGPTKYGISGNAHPGIDIRNLSVQQAVQIYHQEYWEPMKIDSLPEPMRLRAFDAAVSAGIPKAQEFLREAGGDPARFDELRNDYYKSLVERDPAKYGKYLKGWMNRVAQISGGVPLSEGYDLATRMNAGDRPTTPATEEVSNWGDDGQRGFLSRFLENESGAVGGAEREPAPEEDHWGQVAEQFGDADKPQGIVDQLKGGWHQFYLDMFAPDHPAGALVDAVQKGDSPEAANDLLGLKRIAEAANNSAMYALQKGAINLNGDVVGRSFTDIDQELQAKRAGAGGKIGDGYIYAGARWAAEMAAKGLETPIPAAAALKVIQDGHAQYGKAFSDLVDFQNHTLEWMKDSGIHSQAQFDGMVAGNRARIPGYRTAEEVEHVNKGSGGSGKPAFNPIRKAEGSDLQIVNTRQAIIQDTFLRRALADNNQFASRALDAALTVDGLARIENEAAVHIPTTADETGKIDPDMDKTVAQLTGRAFKSDEVPIFQNGIMKTVVFADPDLAGMLRGLDKTTLTFTQKLLSYPAKFQRGMIVMNPAFPIHLLGYDIPVQAFKNDGVRNTVAQAISGIGHVFGKTAVWDEWMRKGAPDKIFEGMSKDAYMKRLFSTGAGDPTLLNGAWNVINTPYRLLRSWSMNMSQVMPVGRYAQVREQVSQPQAAYQASEAPFHRAGFGGPGAKSLNANIPFFSAYVNGLEKTARAMIGVARPGERELDAQGQPIVWNKKQMLLTWAKGSVLTAIAVMQELNDKDKIWYQNVPNYVKDNAVVFHVGPDWERTNQVNETGAPVYVPNGHTFVYKMPPLISSIFMAIPRRLVSQFAEDNPHAWSDIGKSIGTGLLPPGGMYPSFLLPFLEHAAHYSFFGQHSLATDRTKEDLQTPEQYTAYSSSTAKLLAKFANDVPLINKTGLTPRIIDNYISQWGGSLGAEATKTVDQLRMAAGVSGNRQASPHWPEDNPFFQSFTVRYPSYDAQSVQDLNTRLHSFDGISEELTHAYSEGNIARFNQLIADKPGLAMAHRLDWHSIPPPANMQAFNDALNQAPQPSQQAIRFVEGLKAVQAQEKLAHYIEDTPIGTGTGEMTRDDKRQQLDARYATIAVMAKRVSQLADEAGVP